jgi:hypothetical protein
MLSGPVKTFNNPSQQVLAEQTILAAREQCKSDIDSVFDRSPLPPGSPRRLAAMNVFASLSRSFSDRDEPNMTKGYRPQGDMDSQEADWRNMESHPKPFSYTSLADSIAWEISHDDAVQSCLGIDSVDSFMGLLRAACSHEAEHGQVQRPHLYQPGVAKVANSTQSHIVRLSLICLQDCLDAFKLLTAGFLSSEPHKTCENGQCEIDGIVRLRSHLDSYIANLSHTLLSQKKDQYRRHWLSVFHSLCIQTYVQSGLVFIKKEQMTRIRHIPSPDFFLGCQYLRVPTLLFHAVVSQYDSQLGREMRQILTQISLSRDTSIPDSFESSLPLSTDLAVMETSLGAEIETTYDSFARLLQPAIIDNGQNPGSQKPLRTGRINGSERAASGASAPPPLTDLRQLAKKPVPIANPHVQPKYIDSSSTSSISSARSISSASMDSASLTNLSGRSRVSSPASSIWNGSNGSTKHSSSRSHSLTASSPNMQHSFNHRQQIPNFAPEGVFLGSSTGTCLSDGFKIQRGQRYALLISVINCKFYRIRLTYITVSDQLCWLHPPGTSLLGEPQTRRRRRILARHFVP